MPDRPHPFLRALPLILILVVAGVGALTLRDTLSFEALRRHHEALMQLAAQHYALTATGFVLLYTAIVALSLPGATICTLAGGFLFGVFPGVLFNVGAATAGAVLVFLAARAGFGERIAGRLDSATGALARLRDGLQANEIPFLLVMRLVPAVPFFVANLVPAFLGIRLGRFAATTFVGILPASLVFTWVGSGLGAVIEMGTAPDLGVLFHPQILAPLLALAALAVVPVVVKAMRR